MKKLYFIFATTLIMLMGNSFNTIAQAPEGFTYQAEARDAAGKLLVNKSLIVKTTILVGSATGGDVWDENYNVTTDKYGLFSIVVGDAGTETSFSGIKWGVGKYFLNVQIKNGTTWINAGTTQLLSVPYALYAKSAGSAKITETDPVFTGSSWYSTTNNSSNWNTAFGWGNHVGLYRPVGWVPAWNDVSGKPFLIGTSPKNGDLLWYDAGMGRFINWTPDYLTSYTETDPQWTTESANYYTKTNLQTSGQSQLHFNNLINKPTTLAGYGIIDAGVVNFTESNYLYNSKYGVKLHAKNDAQTNVDFVLTPKGYGAFLLQQPDGTKAGGNNRGNGAVDLQRTRNLNTQVASGELSVVIGGKDNTASGLLSVVIGNYSVASGNWATALGSNATASELYAFAAGYNSLASGTYSIALGTNVTAGGYGSLSTGFFSKATGIYSTAMGANTTAPSGYEMVTGQFNTLYTPAYNEGWNSGDRLFVVGNGTNDASRSNALTILKNANTTIGGSLTINGNGTGTSYSFPEGRGTSGQVLKTNADGTTSWAAAGLAEESDPVYLASPAAGISAGNIDNWNLAYGWGNHAGLYRSIDWAPGWNDVSGKPTFAIVATSGNYNDLTNKPIIPTVPTNVSAFNNDAGYLTSFPGLTNFTESNFTYDAKIGVKLTPNNSATNVDFVLQPKGTGAIIADQPAGTTAGGNKRGNGAVDLQMGRDNATQVASGLLSTIVGGYGNTANGDFSTAMGYGNVASGWNSTAIGNTNVANGDYSLALGYGTTTSGNVSRSLGYGTIAPSGYETVLGNYNTNYTPSSTTSWEASDRLFVVGNGIADYSRSNALTILKNGNTTFGGSLTINGNGTNTSYSFPTGRGTSGQVLKTNADGTTSWAAAGLASESDPVYLASPAAGISAGNIDNWNLAYGWGNHAGLYRSIDWAPGWNDVSGKPTFAIVATSGNYNDLTNKPIIPTVPTNVSAFNNDAGYLTSFPGLTNFTESNFTYDSRIGVKFTPNNASTHVDLVLSPKESGAIIAQQPDGTATGGNKRGYLATDLQRNRTNAAMVASANYATIVGGENNTASGKWSTAMGSGVIASGLVSTAMGHETTASGNSSTAMGAGTIASGEYSTALGYFSAAPSAFEIVLGSYNTNYTPASTYVWNATDRLFVIGNGTGPSEESNALTILKNANTTIGGSLTINGNGTNTSLTFPAVRGNSGQVLTTDGSGGTSWTAPTSGTVTGVTGTAPIASSGGTAPVISISAATTSAAGSMSSLDKTKLDGIAVNANNYIHPTGDGNLHIPATGTTNAGKVLTAGATAGSLSWVTPSSGTITSVSGTAPIAVATGTSTPVISISVATTSAAGSMSAADKIKLNGIDGSETKLKAGSNITITGSGTTGLPYIIEATVGTHTIGESYGGGIVFYVYDGGRHGLIAATTDQSTGIRWYGGSNTNTRARADGIGAGLKNTAIIIANQGPVDGNAFAATVCNEYSVTVDGVTYGDWYLPSKHELNLLYVQKDAVGGFASSADYFSSSEYNNSIAWGQDFTDGLPWGYLKSEAHYVRAVRAF